MTSALDRLQGELQVMPPEIAAMNGTRGVTCCQRWTVAVFEHEPQIMAARTKLFEAAKAEVQSDARAVAELDAMIARLTWNTPALQVALLKAKSTCAAESVAAIDRLETVISELGKGKELWLEAKERIQKNEQLIATLGKETEKCRKASTWIMLAAVIIGAVAGILVLFACAWYVVLPFMLVGLALGLINWLVVSHMPGRFTKQMGELNAAITTKVSAIIERLKLVPKKHYEIENAGLKTQIARLTIATLEPTIRKSVVEELQEAHALALIQAREEGAREAIVEVVVRGLIDDVVINFAAEKFARDY